MSENKIIDIRERRPRSDEEIRQDVVATRERVETTLAEIEKRLAQPNLSETMRRRLEKHRAKLSASIERLTGHAVNLGREHLHVVQPTPKSNNITPFRLRRHPTSS